MLNFGIKIVLLLLIVSGSIAYIGDLLGRTVGRKRLTLFGLRPRYTAIFFTIASGILIAIITLSFLLVISNDAKTAFFGLEKLQNEIQEKSTLLNQKTIELNQKTADLDKLKTDSEAIKEDLESKIKQRDEVQKKLVASRNEVAQLQSTKEKLTQEILKTRKGTILFRVGEPIISATVKGGEKPAATLNNLITLADRNYKSLGIESTESLIVVDPANLQEATEVLSGISDNLLVKFLATRNVIFGEKIPVVIKLYKNELLYKKGATVAVKEIDGSLSREKIEDDIKKLLAEVHVKAIEKGIQPDPSGSIGEVTYAEIYKLSNKIKLYNKKVELTAQAANDTYTLGPLNIEFKLKYK
ncbi:MAG: DUF3084 domain-containing protein [Candidatus Margulisbacteria bacterium]|nr:DUF3084 domain-containing protein [Candidatus Margulisiibacteriota bacterium]MBU1021330.1 DUF3084 domain-containing protein [Candidatus Margulisiibacteriota bacterium]MBU1729181.1 DUF3084 domain-containing protein [Candidatus Margulisiibacteriota bacterium]MBU1954854.1 DUF3084 domain-containing protein [Candidatus Margulisiibacteriota bacterium]